MIQENKRPTAAPSSGISDTPPANTSMSSTFLNKINDDDNEI